jgi:hypothetical protein
LHACAIRLYASFKANCAPVECASKPLNRRHGYGRWPTCARFSPYGVRVLLDAVSQAAASEIGGEGAFAAPSIDYRKNILLMKLV